MGNPLKTQSLQGYADQAVVDKFNQLFYDKPDTWGNMMWMGYPIQKYPTDLLVYAEIIYKTRPTFIIETGTAFGGSALFLAHICDIVGTGHILSIDIHNPNDYSIQKPVHDRIGYFEKGSSTDQKLLNDVKSMLNHYPGNTMVILDSDHSKEHVLAELEAYSKFVTPGCYLIVEDTNLNGHPVWPDHGPGPMEALKEWLPKNSQFQVDESCNRFMLTAHPKGYLVRK